MQTGPPFCHSTSTVECVGWDYGLESVTTWSISTSCIYISKLGEIVNAALLLLLIIDNYPVTCLCRYQYEKNCRRQLSRRHHTLYCELHSKIAALLFHRPCIAHARYAYAYNYKFFFSILTIAHVHTGKTKPKQTQTKQNKKTKQKTKTNTKICTHNDSKSI